MPVKSGGHGRPWCSPAGRDHCGNRFVEEGLSGVLKAVEDAAGLGEIRRVTVVDVASKEYEELKTVPRLIYMRDTTRENIVTVFSLSVMLLIEFVLREYFGKIKMELRTFIEYFLYAPTKVRTSAHRILYQLEANPRNLKRTEQLRRACQEVTRRELRKDGKLVVFEVVDPPG